MNKSEMRIRSLFQAQRTDMRRIQDELAAIKRNEKARSLASREELDDQKEKEFFLHAAESAFNSSDASSIQMAYTGMERVLKSLLKELDGFVPSGESWHRELLNQSSESGPARPPLVCQDTLANLEKLRSFRHFLRNAYGIPLNTERLGEMTEACLLAFEGMKNDLASLQNELIKDVAESSPDNESTRKPPSP